MRCPCTAGSSRQLRGRHALFVRGPSCPSRRASWRVCCASHAPSLLTPAFRSGSKHLCVCGRVPVALTEANGAGCSDSLSRCSRRYRGCKYGVCRSPLPLPPPHTHHTHTPTHTPPHSTSTLVYLACACGVAPCPPRFSRRSHRHCSHVHGSAPPALCRQCLHPLALPRWLRPMAGATCALLYCVVHCCPRHAVGWQARAWCAASTWRSCA